jgi:hypothetical protein
MFKIIVFIISLLSWLFQPKIAGKHIDLFVAKKLTLLISFLTFFDPNIAIPKLSHGKF